MMFSDIRTMFHYWVSCIFIENECLQGRVEIPWMNVWAKCICCCCTLCVVSRFIWKWVWPIPLNTKRFPANFAAHNSYRAVFASMHNMFCVWSKLLWMQHSVRRKAWNCALLPIVHFGCERDTHNERFNPVFQILFSILVLLLRVASNFPYQFICSQ